VTLGTLGKEVGARWAALPEEEKAEWKARAAQLKEAGGDDAGKGEKRPRKDKEQHALPLSVLKKIVAEDDEVKRVQPAAYSVVLAAVDLFLADLLGRSREVAVRGKRATIKPDDIARVVEEHFRGDGPFFFLQDMIADEMRQVIAEREAKRTEALANRAGGRGDEEGGAVEETRKKKAKVAQEGGNIAAFFDKPAPADAGEE